MSLSDESRTLLRLMLARGKSYADIAALLGVEEDAARSRARDALSGLAPASDPPLDPEACDFLLGQADEFTAAAVRKRIGADAAFGDRIAGIEDQLALIAPGSGTALSDRPPAKPATRFGQDPVPAGPDGASPPPAAAGTTAFRPGAALAPAQRRLVAILLGAALLAAILVLLLTGVLGSGDDDAERAGNPAPTSVVLQPAAGETGDGSAQIGFDGQGGLAANIQAAGVKPNREGEVYAVWLRGLKGAFPIGQTQVGRDGAIGLQAPLMGPELCLIADGTFTEISLSRVGRARLTRDVKARQKNRSDERLPGLIGRLALRGRISMPQDARDRISTECDRPAQDAG